MKKKRNKLNFILLIILYIFISPDSEGFIYKFNPLWSIDLYDAKIEKSESDFLIPFKTSGIAGYFDLNGKLNHTEKIFHGTAQASSHYINYSRVNDNLVLKKSNGEFAESLNVNGYPVFINNRLFIIAHNRKKISEWNLEGEILSTYEKESEITSLDANSTDFTAGFVDGTIIVSDQDGNVKELIKPVSSRINAVFGTAISGDSDIAAMISGIDPQYVIVMKKNSSQYNSFLTAELPESLRYSRLIKFSEDSKFLFFEGMNYFYCYDLKKKKLNSTMLDSRITEIRYSSEKELFFVITENTGNNIFYILYPDGRILYRKNFTGKDVFLESEKNRFFIGSENYIYSLEMVLE